MKKLLLPFLMFFLCSGQTNKNKEGFKRVCISEINVQVKNGKFTEAQAEKLCDCWAQIVANNYATRQEADADRTGTRQMRDECMKF